MTANRLVTAYYELDNGSFYRIKIASGHYDILPTKNPSPLPTRTAKLPDSVRPRKLVCIATDGTGRKIITVPSKTDWTATVFGLGQKITYSGKEWLVTEKIPEEIY